MTKAHVYASNELQTLIDQTPANSALYLENRTYTGPVEITKPIAIFGGDKTTITSETNGVTITSTNNVQLQSIHFAVNDIAVRMEDVSDSRLAHIQVQENNKGIQIYKSNNIQLQNIEIDGRTGHFATKGNGISLFDSQYIEVSNSKIQNVHDGLYFENTDNVTAENNQIRGSRYGIHLMYADNIDIQHNQLSKNVTGIMTMMVNGMDILHNTISKHNQLNSNGLILFDVREVTVAHNELTENTVATVLQNAKATTLQENVFRINGTVIQVKKSPEAIVSNNKFFGNILAASSDTEGVHLSHNQYDDYSGKDYNGDGIGDTQYMAAKSFGQWMVRKPVYQYFVESPSVVLLNLMDNELKGKEQQILVDDQPVIMEENLGLKLKLHIPQLLIGLIGILFVILVRRKLI